MEIKLKIGNEIKDILSERGIKEEDIMQAIDYAEQTGQKLQNTESKKFLAKKKIDEFTVYAEYSKVDDVYEIHTAYGHRTSILSDVK